MGRPFKEPSTVIGIPVDKVAKVEKILGRKLAVNQTPIVKVRVPTADVEKIRKAIK
jgi:hypothetical protein